MKKISFIMCVVCLLFCCISCSSQDIDKRRTDMKVENMKIEGIKEEYDKTLNEVKSFNNTFSDSLLNFSTDTSVIDKFFIEGNTDILSNTFDILEVSEENPITSVDSYPFLDEDIGHIIDYVVIKTFDVTYIYHFEWQEGKIINIVSEYGG